MRYWRLSSAGLRPGGWPGGGRHSGRRRRYPGRPESADDCSARAKGEALCIYAFRRDELMEFLVRPRPAPADTCELCLSAEADGGGAANGVRAGSVSLQKTIDRNSSRFNRGT